MVPPPASVIVALIVCVQLLASVTVTLYTAAARPVTVAVVDALGSSQR